jgi:hypothetical protein
MKVSGMDVVITWTILLVIAYVIGGCIAGYNAWQDRKKRDYINWRPYDR